MLKKLLLGIMLIAPLAGFSQKFGVIDTDALIEQMPQIKEVQATINESSQKYEAEFNKLKQELENKYAELQQLGTSTPEVIRERRLKEIQELDQKINQFRQAATEDLERQEEELMRPVRQAVSEAVRNVGIEGDFIIIFENTTPAYTRSDVIDVTPMVKSKLGIL